jgi:hypothetical protein
MGKLEDASIRKARPSTYLFRAGASFVHGHITGSTPERAARELFGTDPVTAEILKAASSPAQMTTTGWAAELARLAIEDLVAEVGASRIPSRRWNQTMRSRSTILPTNSGQSPK